MPVLTVSLFAAAYLIEVLADRKPPLALPTICSVLLSLASPARKALQAQPADTEVRESAPPLVARPLNLRVLCLGSARPMAHGGGAGAWAAVVRSTHHCYLPGERLGADEHWAAGPPLCGRVSLGSLLSLSPRPLRRRWWSSGRPLHSAATVLRLR